VFEKPKLQKEILRLQQEIFAWADKNYFLIFLSHHNSNGRGFISQTRGIYAR